MSKKIKGNLNHKRPWVLLDSDGKITGGGTPISFVYTTGKHYLISKEEWGDCICDRHLLLKYISKYGVIQDE